MAYLALLHLPAKALGDTLNTLAGHALDDVVGIRHHNRHIVSVDQSTNETARAELVHFGMCGTVQVQCDVEALFACLVRPPQHRRIVTTDLGISGAVGCGTVELVQDEAAHRVYAVVHTGGQHVDTEGVLLWRAQAKLRAGAVDLRSHVHGGSRVVRWHPLGVEGDGGLASVDEEVDRHRRDGDALAAVLHAGGVAVGAEDLDGGVAGCAEGLEALVDLLTIVEGGRHAVEADEGVGDKLQGRPFAGLLGVVGLDVAIDCSTGRTCQLMGEQAIGTPIDLPSCMRKPMLAQSRALDGGGGNEGIVRVVSGEVVEGWWGGCPESNKVSREHAKASQS